MPTRPDSAAFEMACAQVADLIAQKQADGAFQPGQTVALDFDGPVHRYSEGWRDGAIYDEPAPLAREAVEFLRRYWNVPIFTARANIADAESWLRCHGFPVLKVTNRKPIAIGYIDDRAVAWRNWPQAVIDLAALVMEKESE